MVLSLFNDDVSTAFLMEQKSHGSIEPDGLLPCSVKSTTGPYPEPVKRQQKISKLDSRYPSRDSIRVPREYMSNALLLS